MSFYWLEKGTSLQYVGLLANTLVHVVMYTYYIVKASGKKRVWWKPLVTAMQLLQFFVSFCLFLFTSYLHLGTARSCAGYPYLVVQIAFNLILFVGFVDVFRGGVKVEGGERTEKPGR